MTDVGAVFAELGRSLAGRTPHETLESLVAAVPGVVPGSDHVGIAALDTKGAFKTLVASDAVVEQADQIQREVGEGPCLDASADQSVRHDEDLTVRPSWPSFARRLLDETPVRSALACPLVLDERRTGALNLFADRPRAFGAEGLEHATIVAAFATVAVDAAVRRQKAETLAAGLETNRVIGAAVGMLMATHDIDQDAAFAMLAQASQRLNRKLRDLAEDIVTRHGQDSRGARAPDR